ncbi:MAG: hypothetical protein ABI977_17505, partial [Acidobacteriota bacterium]
MKTRTTLALCALLFGLAWASMSPSKVASIINELGIKGLGPLVQLSHASAAAAAAAAFAPAPMGAKVCGVVSAYTPATNVAGSLRIGGLTFAIAPVAALQGVAVGQDSCFNFCFDDQGRIIGQDGNASAGQGLPQVCGIVTKFSASVGGVNGAVTIGGANIRLVQGTYFGGQDQVAPGSNSCLIPFGFGDLAGAGSFFIQNSSPKQVRIPALVRGQTFDSQEDTFYLPEPTILTLDSNLASVFTVGQNTFG